MPELPEVETIKRQLARLVLGKTISSIEILNKGSFRAEKNSFIGKSITRVGRKGKVLTLSLQNDLQLFVHLKMSGRLLILPQQYARHSRGLRPRVVVSPVPRWVRGAARLRGLGVQADFSDEKSGPVRKNVAAKHLRVRINFQDGDSLEFHDQRKFGWISGDPAVLPRGVDALDPALSSNLPRQRRGKLAKILASSNRPVKTILLDQSKIAGIGNIYASEILWQAGISPFRKGVSLPRQGDSLSKISEKFRKLLTAIREVLTDAIDSGGSTMDDGLYRHVGGESGNYWPRRRVYDREGEPCLRCKIPIKKSIIGQRSTYWCASCQSN